MIGRRGQACTTIEPSAALHGRTRPERTGSGEKPHSTKPSSNRFLRAIRRPWIRIPRATGEILRGDISEVIDMAESTTDHSILKKIEGLVHEEQHLYGKDELAGHDRVRLEAIKIQLDQMWDLLRQRDARREFGQDPNEAKVRPPSVVERYKQ
jgi:hypothetical protein